MRCNYRCDNVVSGDDVCAVHELCHLNVLQLSMRRHVPSHDLRGSDVRRCDLVSGSTNHVFQAVLHAVVR
jgi:hypothetical protein